MARRAGCVIARHGATRARRRSCDAGSMGKTILIAAAVAVGVMWILSLLRGLLGFDLATLPESILARVMATGEAES